MALAEILVDEMILAGLKKQIDGFEYVFADSLELGGSSRLTKHSLNQPIWNAEVDSIPHPTESLDCVMSFHFLEHIQNLTWVMRECERVLLPGGRFLSAVPYYKSQLAFQDPDHKRFFTEETFEFFCKDRGYKDWDGTKWQFQIKTQFIAGVVEKNLMLFTVLEKTNG